VSSLKVRDLSKYGIITDVDPFDLPPEAWSFGTNVRFHNGRALRGPVFRHVADLPQTSPRYCASSTPTTGLDLLVTGFKSGRVYSYSSGTFSNLSVTSYVDNDSELPWTHTHLADVFYLNRGDRAPWYKRSSDSIFQTLPNWDPAWRAQLLRSVGNALVALNVTKSGVSFPTMIKTSSLPTAGTVPVSWNEADLSTDATENILAELEGPIVDACSLSNTLFIYGFNEAWLMQPDGSERLYSYSKRFANRGAINANCSIEIGGRHYVFGINDIWMHDGVTPVSIADHKCRDFIFGSINVKKANRCFVSHDQARNEVKFHFVSGDRGIAFVPSSLTGGCNRAAVYNYVEQTWTFDDLPFVYGSIPANLDNQLTYASVTSSYDSIGGSYLDQEDGFKKAQVYVGELVTSYGITDALYAFDSYGEQSTVAFPVDSNATANSTLERDGIDLDEIGADLTGYKIITCVYPQGRIDPDSSPVQFRFGAADHFNQAPQFSDWQDYDGADLSKLDFMQGGRFLSCQIKFNDHKQFTLSGLDVDVEMIGD
jgi:hypothetical protein